MHPVLEAGGVPTRVWEAQAELFVRWALSGRVDGGPERLGRFVEGASSQRTTEEFFFSCFGIDYADALDALSDYLPHAVEQAGVRRLPAPRRTRPTPDSLRGGELRPRCAGVKTEWSRRVLGAIKKDNPGAFPLFEGKVRDAAEGAYDMGERDPDFLASLALFRIQYGDRADGTRRCWSSIPGRRRAAGPLSAS